MLRKNFVTYMIMVLLFLFSVAVTSVDATPTTLEIEPQTITVGPPVPTDLFLINITVNDVTDLYFWQVKIFYDSTILNCTSASLPSYHVFAGKVFQGPNVLIEKDNVIVGATLMGAETPFTGSGVLCQIEFKGIAIGTSYLNFSRPYDEDTYLFDDMPISVESIVDGSVTVIPEFPSFIVMALFMIATIAAAFLTAKGQLKKR